MAQIRDQIRQPRGAQPYVGTVRADIDACYEQLHDARLLGREQFVRKFFDHMLIWNDIDLERKLEEFRNYYNEMR